MSSTSWRGQVYRALQAIDCLGHSKYEAKQVQGWQPGQPVHGLYSFGYKNLVFDRAITFTNWLRDQYPDIRLFRDVDSEMTAEYLSEKAETCTPDTLRTALATLKKLVLLRLVGEKPSVGPVRPRLVTGNAQRRDNQKRAG